jgi:hypothetical protein
MKLCVKCGNAMILLQSTFATYQNDEEKEHAILTWGHGWGRGEYVARVV